jgi:amino acid adenylation domain-containing protein
MENNLAYSINGSDLMAMLQEVPMASHSSYWKQKLAGLPPLLELPVDKPRPPIQTFSSDSVSFELSVELMQQLKQLRQKSGTTLSIILLTTLAVLLSRYSRQTDIPIGTAIVDRNRKEVESLISCFVNTLVVRVNLDDNPTFVELLNQVRQVALEGYAYQDVPFEKVVEELQPERSLSYHPLFQVMFIWQNTSKSENVVEEELHSGTSKFDLTLSLEEREETIRGCWEYSNDLFEADTIARMVGHFQNLLSGIVSHPETRVNELPILAQRERQQLLVEWNQTNIDYPKDKCLHQLFEEQTARTPDAVALVWDEKRVTYGELNEKANRLARYLRDLGVKPDVLVGICLERSLEMVVAILGILKAGGAYLPLDPAYPRDRSTFMLDNARASIVLSQQSLLDTLSIEKINVICLDTNWDAIESESPDNLDSDVQSQHLAYVIYSSGSTGQPKGIAIAHHSTVNFIFWAHSVFSPEQLSGVLASTSICFDLSIFELFVPLSCGGRVILAINALYLPTLKAAAEVTLINTVPSAIAELCRNQAIPESVKTINLAGEPLSTRLVEQIYQQKEDVRVFNLYGPSETTTYSTFTLCTSNSDRSPLIGRPLSNTQIYILDTHLQPVPIGVAGELYIGGDGLAREYLNRPDLTNEKFISNPFEEGRLYKTGDLARYLANGEIDFLGRIDNQVKLRGFRIELGEIEAVLNQHPDIKEAVVIVREDSPNDKRLVAYIVPVTLTKGEDIKEMRGLLRQKLPNYMIPAVFVVLDRLPLTPNGKIDRRALPIPVVSNNSQTTIAATTPQEQILVTIWQEVLKLETVGIEDNFFELGGHSLLATQVISRIRDIFTIELPLRSLFESPTIAALGLKLTENDSSQESHYLSLPPIRVRTESKNLSLPLSFPQARLWFLNQLEGDSATYNISTVLQLQGRLDTDALRQAIESIVDRHEILRTNFIDDNGSPHQIIRTHANIELPLIDLQQLPETGQKERIKRIIRENSHYSFNLATESLLRTNLIRQNAENHLLAMTIHHIIADGWSMGIFIRELTTLYQAYSSGQISPLNPLPIQYTDFALWQQQYFSPEFLAPQLSYWKEQLAGLPPLLELPTDKSRPAIQTFSGQSLAFELPSELTQQLKQLSQQSGVTLYMTLLAVLAVLLSRYSHQTDIPIGTAIANRNRKEIESLIGFFVNNLVLRFDLTDNPTFAELLQQARQIALEGYANQDVPFEKVVEELQPERSLSYHPLFQVMFVWQNTPKKEWDLADLNITEKPITTDTAKFDLTLSLEEKGETITGFWEYNMDLFEVETIKRMMGHFQTLVTEIASNSQARIGELPLLTAEEKQQLLVEWNQTVTDYPKDKCIHQLFEEQTAKTPDAVALVWREEQFTYRQLNEKANRLARYLQELGVKPDVLVGIYLERSLETIVAIIAILKAGGAYLPLDSTYPSERLAVILTDAQVSILLSQVSLLETIPRQQTTVVCLDRDYQIIESMSGENLPCQTNSDNLAYVMYTSGSTGIPKGVCIPHRGVVRLVKNTNYASFSADEVFLQLAPVAFDAATLEIFAALLHGAKLVVYPDNQPSLTELGRIIRQQRITTLWLTAGLFHLMVDEYLDDLKSLRQLLAGGDVLSVPHVRKVLDNLENCQLINGYGPTENTTFSCCYPVAKTDSLVNSIPIGRPISNTQVYILDRLLQLVPIGVWGELYVGGDGLAKGYLNRDDLTREKFIDNPFEEGRLYKTGDLVRYLADGKIEFLGRADNQIKLRGFRIELGEIEAALSQYPQIKEAAVIVREDSPNDKRLVAYIVTVKISPCSLEISKVRDFLQHKLPNYMIPNALVILDKLPLTSNGKVDRRALPIPDLSRQDTGTNFVTARDDLELQLVRIWEEVLGVKPIGIYDDFFELGGSSLLSLQLLARLDSNLAFSTKIPLKALFKVSTIARLADILRQEKVSLNIETELNNSPKNTYRELSNEEKRWLIASNANKQRALDEFSTIAIEKIGTSECDRPLFFSYILGKFVPHLDKKQTVYNLSVWTKVEHPDTFIQSLAAQYIAEIRTIQPSGPYVIGGFCFGGLIALEIAQQLQAQKQKVALLILVETPSRDFLYNRYKSFLQSCRYNVLFNLAILLRNSIVQKQNLLFPFIKQKLLISKKIDDNKPIEKEELADDLFKEEIVESIRKAIERYNPKHYNGKVALFFAAEGKLRSLFFPKGGWEKILRGKVSKHFIPGDHIGILKEPNASILAEKIQACLDSLNLTSPHSEKL